MRHFHTVTLPARCESLPAITKEHIVHGLARSCVRKNLTTSNTQSSAPAAPHDNDRVTDDLRVQTMQITCCPHKPNKFKTTNFQFF